MVTLEASRLGEVWELVLRYPAAHIAMTRFNNGDILNDLPSEDMYTEGKYDFRLIDESENVLAHWVCIPYHEPEFINLLADNPLQALFDAYQLTDEEAQSLVDKWLKA